MHTDSPPDIDVRHIFEQGTQPAVTFDTIGRAEIRHIPNDWPFSWLIALQVSITYLIELRFTDEQFREFKRPLRMRKQTPNHLTDEPATFQI